MLLAPATFVCAQDAELGNVTIHSDPRLAILLRESHLLASTSTSATHPGDVGTKAAVVALPLHQPLQPHEVKTLYSGKGYRVQIYNGSDRAKAMQVKAEFMRHFPGVHSYLIYNAPSFRVRVGDFKNRSDAQGMMHETRSLFGPGMIVPDIVTISTY